MKILLLTDTHGNLDIINSLIKREQANACIHLGDFGFYDEDSVHRLSTRELALRVKHSHLEEGKRKHALKMDRDELIQLISQDNLLGGFSPYLKGTKTFNAPVYVVYGNHEDLEVVKRLASKETNVPNIHIIDENNAYEPYPGVRILGLGGNFYYPGDEGLFAEGLTGHGGKVRASFTQIAKLIHKANDFAVDAVFTIFASHVSPGKVRLLERLCMKLGVDLAVYGHMDPVVTGNYSLFNICEPSEVKERAQVEWESLFEAYERNKNLLPETRKRLITYALYLLKMEGLKTPGRGARPKKGSLLHGYFKTQFLGLADAPHSWSILEINEKKINLTHKSKWTQ